MPVRVSRSDYVQNGEKAAAACDVVRIGKFDRVATKPSTSLRAAVLTSNGAKYHSEVCVAPAGMYVVASLFFCTMITLWDVE